MRIILGSHKKLEIGVIYKCVRDYKKILHPDQTFKVIGESSLDEWIESYRSFGEEPEDWEVMLPCQYYYEVQVD